MVNAGKKGQFGQLKYQLVQSVQFGVILGHIYLKTAML